MWSTLVQWDCWKSRELPPWTVPRGHDSSRVPDAGEKRAVIHGAELLGGHQWRPTLPRKLGIALGAAERIIKILIRWVDAAHAVFTSEAAASALEHHHLPNPLSSMELWQSHAYSSTPTSFRWTLQLQRSTGKGQWYIVSELFEVWV